MLTTDIKDYSELTEKQQQIANEYGRIGIIAQRHTIEDAYEYATHIAKASGPTNEAHILTAIRVLMNTYACHIAEIAAPENCPCGVDDPDHICSFQEDS